MALQTRFLSLILAGSFFLTAGFSKRAYADPSGSRDEAARVEELDRFAMRLEAARLQVLFARATGQPAPPLMIVLFPPMVAYVRNPANQASFADIERALRRTNSGIHLFAVHESRMTDTRLRVTPLPGRPPTSHWLFMSNQGPEAARTHRRENGIGSDEENLRLLETVGVLSAVTAL